MKRRERRFKNILVITIMIIIATQALLSKHDQLIGIAMIAAIILAIFNKYK